MSSRTFQEGLPRKRMAAGGLFFDPAGNLLIVKPTYKATWNIPGGIVEADEAPRQACLREVREEIGLDCSLRRLLYVDYTSPDADHTESLQFIFLGDTLSAEEIATISLPAEELSAYRFMRPEQALPLFTARLHRRVSRCLEVLHSGQTLYLEDQK